MSGQGIPTDGAGAPEGVHVRVHFKVPDEQTAQAVAGAIVDRAHEIANQPDSECDVDVSVEWSPPGDSSGQVGRLAESARGRPTDL